MKLQQGIPTFEEFVALVKDAYLNPNWVADKQDTLRYFYGDEAQNHIRNEYALAVEEYDAGELGVEGFRIGFVSRVAYCLFLMYE